MPLSCAHERGSAGGDCRRGGPPTPGGDRAGVAGDRSRRRGAQQRRRRPVEPHRQAHHRPVGAPVALEPPVFGAGGRPRYRCGDARAHRRQTLPIARRRRLVRGSQARAPQAADPQRKCPGAVLPGVLRAGGDERRTRRRTITRRRPRCCTTSTRAGTAPRSRCCNEYVANPEVVATLADQLDRSWRDVRARK